MKLILASKSPRRKEILKKAGYDFKIIPSTIEFDIVGKSYEENLLKECAKSKAIDVFNIIKNEPVENEDVLIIASDTIVVNKNIIIGKPKDRLDAISILKSLSGNTHFVETGIYLIKIDSKNITEEKYASEKTYVTFRELTSKEIENYIDDKKPFDKAGAYGIQDDGFDFVEKINGNIDNVMGFPLTTFENLKNL